MSASLTSYLSGLEIPLFFPIPLLSVLVDSQDYRSWLCQAVRPQQPLRLFCGDSSVLGKWWRQNTFFSLHCRRFQRDLFFGFPGSRAYRETKVHSHCGLLELWNIGIWMHHRISSFLTFLAACSLVITIYLNQNFLQFCTIHIFCCLRVFFHCNYTLDLNNVVFEEWVMISWLPRKIFFHHWIVALKEYKLIHIGLDELQDMQVVVLQPLMWWKLLMRPGSIEEELLERALASLHCVCTCICCYGYIGIQH